MQIKKNIPFLLSLLLLPFVSHAQLKAKHVTIFKNGTAFIQKSGKVTLDKKAFKWSDNLPEAIYGTFWFSSPTGTITSVKSKADTVEKSRNWTSFLDLIQSNIGKSVEITMTNGKEVSGEIVSANGSGSGALVLIKHTTGFELVKNHLIERASIKGDLTQTVVYKNVQTTISVNFKEAKSTQNLEATYLSKGFNWTPMYKLLLDGENGGTLSLKASIRNDAENIENANLSLVVGSPNFLTTTQLSDLIAEQFNVYPTWQANNNMAFSNSISGFYESNERKAASTTDNITADGIADLYFFKLDNFSLEKGERAFYPLFETKVKVDHKYVCNLNGNSVVNNTNYIKKYTSYSDQAQFNHQIKIWNNSKNPFTSGTLIVNQKLNGTEQALATAKLNYTAIENCSYVTISNAPDIEIKEEEVETSRTGATKYWGKNKYVAINVKSEITVHNYKSKKAHLEINRLVFGSLKKSDVDWKMKAVGNTYTVNEGTNVTWEMDIEPGAEKVITYTYVVYIRG